MSPSETPSGKANLKTLAIRLEPEFHAQLSAMAQLDGQTLTDFIRQAIDAFVAQRINSGDLANKATAVLEEIEREAEARRQAIATLFGEPDSETGKAKRPSRSSRAKEEPPEE